MRAGQARPRCYPLVVPYLRAVAHDPSRLATEETSRYRARDGVATFRLTDVCNAHCTFCAWHVTSARRGARPSEQLKRLDRELERHGAHPPHVLLVTGGEPTTSRALGAIIERALARGVDEVHVWTNGLALAAQTPRGTGAQVLAALGVTGVRVSLFGGSEAEVAEQMRVPDAASRVRAGVDAAFDAGMRVTLSWLVTEGAEAWLPALADEVATRWPKTERVIAAPARGAPSKDERAPAMPEQPALPPDPRAVEPGLVAAQRRLAQAGIPLAADPGSAWHACAFRKGRTLSALLEPEAPSSARVQLEPCRGCVLRERCGGVERTLAARLGDAAVEPLHDARRALWLGTEDRTVHSARTDRIDVAEARATPDGREEAFVREQVIRILNACNQRCRFCWVDFSLPAMPKQAVLDAIAENLAKAGPEQRAQSTVAFTGGEPAMHPDLVELIAGARALGAARVHLQTNAVRFAEPALARAVAEAGLDEALVSLHAPTAEASDLLTAAPGSFERTVVGIQQLCAAGVDVVINHVLTSPNAPDFPAFIEMVAERLRHPRLVVSVAVAAHIDRGPLDAGVLPTFTEIAASLRQGLLHAAALDIEVRELVHPCGVPPCVLDGDPQIFDRAKMRRVTTAGVLGEAEGCVKPPEICGQCAFEPYCVGVRREYALTHGISELRPIAEAPAVSEAQRDA